MGTPEDADLTTEGVNGTVLGGRQLEAFTWDGKTKYDVKETEEEIKARDAQWEKFLLQQEADKSSKKGDSKPQESQNKPENEKESGNKEWVSGSMYGSFSGEWSPCISLHRIKLDQGLSYTFRGSLNCSVESQSPLIRSLMIRAGKEYTSNLVVWIL